MLKKYENENLYLNKQDKRLNENFKNYSEYYKAILNGQEELIKNLKERQITIRDNYDDSNRQVFDNFI